MRQQSILKRSTNVFLWRAGLPQSMRLLNIFYASKALKNNPFATGHGQRGFGVSGCFVYSI
ncbi:hypothetical protein FEM54_29380 [Pseudomonas edaphica]|jgi:hypothetical protein|uniref:Uncharacterized protein n=1 Tax=Pseudomonas edaphica TaxID=2006980 RepID=A0ABY2TWY8_9PSED|nr:hypothetical protein FEM54_29380 [Pseudomonas edaphica]